MTAVVTVVFTSCPTRGGQQRNQFRTVPNLGMADWTFEIWTGSNMGSSDLEFRLENGPISGLADPELAYSSSLGLDPNWV